MAENEKGGREPAGTKRDTAVIMLAFGGPERLEDVRPFINNVVAGRNVPESRIEEVVGQYKQIGGRSPFNELTFGQASALRDALSESKRPMPVYVGMLQWQPYIADVVRTATADGVTRFVVLIMAAHRSEASFDRYRKSFASALDKVENENGVRPQTSFVEPWHTEPLFAEAIAERTLECLNKLSEVELDDTRIIFTAHSIPEEMSSKSGYADQVRATANLVASRVRDRTNRNLPWTVAYQSRSGPPNQLWLEPDIQHELAVSNKAGKRHVVIVPVGFLCDHVEVLFDLDVLAAQTARELGMNMLRAQTVGDHPKFIRLLAERAQFAAELFYAKPERQ